MKRGRNHAQIEGATIHSDLRAIASRRALVYVALALLSAPASSAGAAGPVLDSPRAMYAHVGGTDSQPLGATDPDAQTLTFYKSSGPSFLNVTTHGPPFSTYATGTATISPGQIGDHGEYDAVIGVTDGVANDEKSFRIHVLDSSPRAMMIRFERSLCFATLPLPVETITMGDASIVARGDSFGVDVDAASSSNYWTVRFTPRPGQKVQAGYVYYQDQGLPPPEWHPSSPVVPFSYEIREAVFGPTNRVISFWATYTTECENGVTTRGEVRYNAHVDVDIDPPAFRTVERGHTLAFDLPASDPDGGSVTLTATTLPPGARFVGSGTVGGSFDWTPTVDQRGLHTAVFEATDGGSHHVRATTTIRVRGETSARFFHPSHWSEDGDGVDFFTPEDSRFEVVVSTQPNGRTVAGVRRYDEPDGAFVTGRWEVEMWPPVGEALGVGVYDHAGGLTREDPTHPALTITRNIGTSYHAPDGRFEIKQLVRDPGQGIQSFWATFEIPSNGLAGDIRYDAETAAVRAFAAPGEEHIHLLGARPSWYLQIEPTFGSFALESLDPETVRLRRTNRDSVALEIQPVPSESTVGDRDGNGVPELAACFRLRDLGEFFHDVRGTSVETMDLEASIASGERIQERVTVRVTGAGGRVSIAAAPNPLNPEATITYYVPEPGTVTVRIYDVGGRLVRTLIDAVQSAGYNSTSWSGDSDTGRKLASGVYYLRIDTASEHQSRSIVLMR